MKVKNWGTWQHYRKDRGTPPWIKIYRNLFSNQEWVQLTDSEKGQLVSIWILASDKSGDLPDDPMVIQKMCMLDVQPNINKFIELGFLVGNRLSSGCQHDAPETETEGEMSDRQPPVLITPREAETETKTKGEAETETENTTSSNNNDGLFDAFWSAYPKKVGKKKCRVAFNRLSTKNKQAAISDAPYRFTNADPQYIPHPTTYIHGENWNDEQPIETQDQADKRFDDAIGRAMDNNIDPPTREEFFNKSKIIEGEYRVIR